MTNATAAAGGWIQTYAGKQFYPLAPTADMIDIRDIAHSLAMQCRFNGHTREFYSVAEHSVRVSLACGRKDALYGLLHDASEAYLCDLPSPIKYAEGWDGYRTAEAALQSVIFGKFCGNATQPGSVKRADALLLNTEARDLLPEFPQWADKTLTQPRTIRPLRTPMAAEQWFLQRFRELGGSAAGRAA